ncbi:4-hydroxy-3-methylbut-2-enyl diphosphate reductase [uncultured Bifidobacterium sp.]|uniref:4-hydroxy-3-methylbut-2-enyl diphosphate reductase n=1 Tax=uncultured Bifidobacterium sp. TaxID=165187 RepID=UPI0028DC9536|nr:4-hydroxy-3-methylbut-2-enyl diphosphate reductase [uncultured Bifidobacterium sp.]
MGGRIILADPRGFCAGVDRAILAVRTILASSRREDGRPPVYVRRQIVHNRHVVEELAGQGAVFVEELEDIPQEDVEAGVPVVFSAHGVSPDVQSQAKARGMRIVDATCPLVSKVHREVQRFVREGYEIVYIGHHGHDEAVGVIGEAPGHVHLVDGPEDLGALDFPSTQRLVLLTQTTLSVDETADLSAAIRGRFPWIEEPPSSDICYATQNRQTAVKLVARRSDAVVIVGSANSSNSVRLMEVAREELGGRGGAWRIDDAGELRRDWFEGVSTVGVSSGASVPDELVAGVVEVLGTWGYDRVEHAGGVRETMHFVMPSQLRAHGSSERPSPSGSMAAAARGAAV